METNYNLLDRTAQKNPIQFVNQFRRKQIQKIIYFNWKIQDVRHSVFWSYLFSWCIQLVCSTLFNLILRSLIKRLCGAVIIIIRALHTSLQKHRCPFHTSRMFFNVHAARITNTLKGMMRPLMLHFTLNVSGSLNYSDAVMMKGVKKTFSLIIAEPIIGKTR